MNNNNNNHEILIRGMLLMLVCLLIYLGVNINVHNTTITDGSTLEEGGEKLKPVKIYLTFDDGPSVNTESVLDTLKEYNVKATFFLVGNSVTEEYEGILQRMIDEGHEIGLHCSCHRYNQVYSDTSSCVESILEERKFLYEEYGIESNICRLPGGSTNKFIKNRDEVLEILHSEGLKVFDWNVTAEDSVGVPTAESIMKNIFPDVYNREEPIVLMHDGVNNKLTADLLPQILEKLTEYGYEFCTLPERDEFLHK